MNFVSLPISEIRIESPEAISVLFDINESQKSSFNFTAGQYLTLSDNISGEDVRRSYSIFTTPGANKIGVTIKKLENGKFSTHAHKYWKEGTIINVGLPEGNFVVLPNHDKNRNHFFVAAGSGITPIYSMITALLEEEPMSRCYLLYGSRDEHHIIFKSMLDDLETKYSGQLFLTHTLSKPSLEKAGGLLGVFKKGKTTWSGETGRIDTSKLKAFFDAGDKTAKEAHYYLCGPSEMIKQAESILDEKGIDKKTIHKEYFTVDESDKKDIKSGRSNVTVILNGETITFTTEGKKPILDELIAMKKNPPYSCTSGACSSCMAKVTSGKVEMEVCYALDDKDIENGLILTCQAKAVTSEVVMTYDI
jgi:ring-1,2-phenylacetyl-CoA epoxidase subunit PaaE